MELYKKYKEAYPNKSDSEIIESLAWELKDKVETIHRLLNENQALHIHDVVGQSEQLFCSMAGKGFCPYESKDGKCTMLDKCVNHTTK